MRRKRICGLSVIPMCAGKWEKSTPTWHELAHRVGIGRQALSAIENGGDFKTRTLDNLAIVLGVSVDFIMYGKNEENSELLSEAMDVLSDMDELQIRQCLAMMKAMKSVSVEK